MKLRWRIAWLLTYPLVRIFLPLRVVGRKNLGDGGQLIVSNHTSNFDPLVLGWATGREIYFLAKKELFRHRAFAWLLRSWNAIPVDRSGDLEAIRRCSEILRRGQTLVLFPEGTRSKTGELGGFKSGIGFLALTNQVPVVPAYIAGMSRSFVSFLVDRDFVRQGWRRRPVRCVPIKVFFGERVEPGGFSRSRNEYERFTRLVEERVRQLAVVCQR